MAAGSHVLRGQLGDAGPCGPCGLLCASCSPMLSSAAEALADNALLRAPQGATCSCPNTCFHYVLATCSPTHCAHAVRTACPFTHCALAVWTACSFTHCAHAALLACSGAGRPGRLCGRGGVRHQARPHTRQASISL